jgi:hypothetical protein
MCVHAIHTPTTKNRGFGENQMIETKLEIGAPDIVKWFIIL